MAEEATRDEHLSAVFATMVMQLTNMAAMFMGKVPNPETKQPTVDLDAAQIFIDQLEMLEVKTKGNLTQEEQSILKQGLTMVRMAFVETVEAAEKKAPAPEKPGHAAAAEEATDPEGRKKFTKKY
jgi:Domain of unknown function (DUF1844)